MIAQVRHQHQEQQQYVASGPDEAHGQSAEANAGPSAPSNKQNSGTTPADGDVDGVAYIDPNDPTEVHITQPVEEVEPQQHYPQTAHCTLRKRR